MLTALVVLASVAPSTQLGAVAGRSASVGWPRKDFRDADSRPANIGCIIRQHGGVGC